jgi:hypothetical protein
MENPDKMSAPDLAPDANIDAMNVATPGKDAPNLDKTALKRALFASPSAVAHNPCAQQDQHLNTHNDRQTQHPRE